ncbi:MAG: hypothetical protein A2W04_02615 [Betaproteobacteria bacterium RBG_16_64_9]|nr:MAG: hypothetical protein A2W04_02615 [Betaproteobacteria bacterium RBG_16_64_9]
MQRRFGFIGRAHGFRFMNLVAKIYSHRVFRMQARNQPAFRQGRGELIPTLRLNVSHRADQRKNGIRTRGSQPAPQQVCTIHINGKGVLPFLML